MKIWVPADAAAKACGADAIASMIAHEAALQGREVQIIRNGTRGMIWLEPLVEIETDGVRMGFGPMVPGDVPALFASPESHPKALGPVEEIPFFARQTRLSFARCGRIDPLSLEDYAEAEGWQGLARALELGPQATIEAVTASGLRGRGGAGFPTGIKWKTVADAKAAQKYIVCNADEGDSGSFADRMLMEGDPYCLIEGMAIAALCVGANKGFVYIRSEYPDAIRVMETAIARARSAGHIGASLMGQGPAFELEVRVGAGAYICGEETSLLNSLEGKRGMVRAKPPLPALEGAFGLPTVVNNVLSLGAVPWILTHGGAAYAEFGLGRSRGTIPLQIAGNVAHGGLFETGFGLSLGTLINDIAGGTASGRPFKAVQVGGPLGAYHGEDDFDLEVCYEAFAGRGGLVGHAGFVVHDENADMMALARYAMEFCAIESCGKCTPCRIGAVRGIETLDRIARGEADAIEILQDLCEVMEKGSLCAMGGFTPYPVRSAMRLFPEEFTQLREAAE